MNPDVKEIEGVFFDAMLAGYANSGVKEPDSGLPGSKCISFQKGIYTVKDEWFVTPLGTHSFGQTIIWRENIPIWCMQYMGHYPDEVIPLLKEALFLAYKGRTFLGGRGNAWHKFKTSDHHYVNSTHKHNFGFTNFSGTEWIDVPSGGLGGHRNKVGWHSYQGQLLLPLKE